MSTERFIPLRDYSERSLAEKAYSRLQDAGIQVLLRHLFHHPSRESEGRSSEVQSPCYQIMVVSDLWQTAAALLRRSKARSLS